MKKTVLALALAAFANSAAAEVVTVAGYGDNYSTALANCQLTAIKRVTGTWIASEQSVKNGKYVEDMAAYDGAIINRTQVLSFDNHAMVCEVDVDPVKDNKVITKQSQVPVPEIKRHNEERQDFDRSLKFVDKSSRALKVIVNDITYKPRGETTIVYVDVDIVWDPKWVSDMTRLLKKTNMKGETTYDLQNQLAGVMGNVAITSGVPVFGAIVGQMMEEKHRITDDNMVCFAERHHQIADDCFTTGRPLNSFAGNTITIYGSAAGGIKFVHKVEQKDMWQRILPHQVKSHSNFRNIKMTYLQPGVAIYTKERQKVRFGFEIKTERLEQADKFNFVIQ